ncbi:MAG: adenine deaminase [Verrucomicrobiales bacterium]|nr:adenine deaminase [Verrucomicrobiales bacterium]
MIEGNVIDIPNREIYFARVEICEGRIASITRCDGNSSVYILPGFVDAHVHVESSMLVPSQFARLAVRHGTVATVSDPHEIANVLGIGGVKYMIEDGKRVPFKFYFGAPSCVPATEFETAGARVDVEQVRELLEMPDVKYLAEMMNYPGVIFSDSLVTAKLDVAKQLGLPVDGHAPGVRGDDLETYVKAGISTDHESTSREEALEKLNLGMKILIREGSAAKNFEALISLLPEFPEQIMFCSDDKHPDDLFVGHINQLVARALQSGAELFDVLRVACINPVEHYGLDVGLLRVGDPADFIVTDDLETFSRCVTYIDGEKAGDSDGAYFTSATAPVVNHFLSREVPEAEFRVLSQAGEIRVIKAIDGELVTESFETEPLIEDGCVVPDIDRDILKIAVINRYIEAPVSIAFINGFGLKSGAIASCVAHDSHNIVAVGVDDRSISQVVHAVMENKGGIAAASASGLQSLPLPVAGIMTNQDAGEIARAYQDLTEMVVEELGTTLHAPFMTLSFMALLVIPSLKLGDRGLFNGDRFEFVDLFVS